MQVVLIDNYDSFTWNLAHLVASITGDLPIVVRNDEASVADIQRLQPKALILSPGPGHPATARDFGICTQVLRSDLNLPVLGVCLGHQGIAAFAGAPVVPATQVMHGLTSQIQHCGKDLFQGVPQGFQAMRYHSFIVASPLPLNLELLAWTTTGEVMALRHKAKPFWGVQFHPESIASEYGKQILQNFLAAEAA